MINIGAKIKKMRQFKKLTQENLSGPLLNRVVLSKIENNKTLPSLPQLIYICNKLNISLSDFFADCKPEISTIHSDKNSYNELEILYLSQNYYDVVKYYEFKQNEFNKIINVKKFFYLGVSYFHLNMIGESLKLLKKYQNFFLKLNNEEKRLNIYEFSYALNTLSKIMLKNSNTDKAKHYLYLAQKYIVMFDIQDSCISYIISNNICEIYLQENDYDKVVYTAKNFTYHYNGFNLCYPIVFANIHNSLAIAYYNINEFDKSIKHSEKCISLYSYIDNTYKEGASYFNYINALRYNNKYEEAFELLERCKKDYISIKDLYQRYLLQEMILYFNIRKYNKVIEISDKIKRKTFDKNSKLEYYFMMGHVCLLNGCYELSLKYLSKCEKYYENNNYNYDLYLLYESLYLITTDDNYIIKKNNLNFKVVRKNILINIEEALSHIFLSNIN